MEKNLFHETTILQWVFGNEKVLFYLSIAQYPQFPYSAGGA